LLLFALAFLFSGCDVLKSLGLIPSDGEEPGPRVWGVPVLGAEEMPSIKEKFAVPETGTAGVDAAFRELSAYIKSGGLAQSPSAIKVGDWIDLEGGLAVAAYSPANKGGADFDYSPEAATAFTSAGEAQGTLCRLIVVGINSFQSKTGGYTYPAGEGTPPPHVVFQFQNIPSLHPMSVVQNNTAGYEGSDGRKYLVPVAGDDKSGNYLKGLKEAGVPDDVLWAPSRSVSAKAGATVIKDKLWLPTQWEILEVTTYTSQETSANQTRLEYYASTAFRLKASAGGSLGSYWTASRRYDNDTGYCYVAITAAPQVSGSNAALGIAPAFCVE
jgi:hypothetical protein